MTDYFIPSAARSSATQDLAHEAWAIAAKLEPSVSKTASTLLPEHSDSSVLVLAQPNDETAERFVAYARASGVRCIMPQQLDEIGLYVAAERNGRVTIEICLGEEQTPVHGILNRGLPPSEDISSKGVFGAAELLSSWWSALAYFAGPVINRPSRQGFLPNLEPLSLVQTKSNIKLAHVYINTKQPALQAEPRTNVHLVRNGQYIGQISKEDGPFLSEDEVYIFTGFDPAQTTHVLLAGHRVFNLSHRLGYITPEFQEQLLDLTDQLQKCSASFSLMVLENRNTELYLIHTTPFPSIRQYHYVEGKVHQALLEYLTS